MLRTSHPIIRLDVFFHHAIAAYASAQINKRSDEPFGKQLVFFVSAQKSNIEIRPESTLLSHSTPFALKFTQKQIYVWFDSILEFSGGSLTFLLMLTERS